MIQKGTPESYAVFSRRTKYPTTIGWYRVTTSFGEATCIWNGKWFGGLLRGEVVKSWRAVGNRT